MASLLNDVDIRKLLGTVIQNGADDSIRSNSYILRLGAVGEFLNANKEFDLEKTNKKGIVISPGHSVAVTSLETLDFSRDEVKKTFPGKDLHAFLTPTTDLSREGIVAPSTQVDAGFHGTLNWTLTNTSSEERRYRLGERIYRMAILLLDEGERPEKLYSGAYQGQTGYVRSRRAGPPVGMKETEWETSFAIGGPEELLDNLIKSGYPWHILGRRLKDIDEQFKLVSEEYGDIHDSILNLSGEIREVKSKTDKIESEMQSLIRATLREELEMLQKSWTHGVGTFFVALMVVGLMITSNEQAAAFVNANIMWMGPAILALVYGIPVLVRLIRPKSLDK